MGFFEKLGKAATDNIPVVGSLIGGVFDSISSNKQQKRQQQHEIDMWNRQNAYNTPAEQQKRLKEAGLNPALMYGQGSTGNASSAPQTTPRSPSKMGKAISEASLAKMQLLQQEKENARADSLMRTQQSVMEAQATKLLSETHWNNLFNPEKLKGLVKDNSAKDLAYKYTNETFNDRKSILHNQVIGSEISNKQADQKLQENIAKFDEWKADTKTRQKMQANNLTMSGLKLKYQESLNKFAKVGLTLGSSEWGTLIQTIAEDPDVDTMISSAINKIKSFNEGTTQFKQGWETLKKLNIFSNPMEMYKQLKIWKKSN